MMQDWFLDAKLGVFVHYGIYAVRSVSESWSFYNGTISHEDYMGQLDGFTASNLDMNAWIDLFRLSGARYAVLTAKHHDGVTLWDSSVGDLSVARRTPARRDIVGEYVRAMRESGIRVGLSFSLSDWSEPTYPTVYPHGESPGDRVYDSRFSSPSDGVERPELWAQFVDRNRAQVEELLTKYGTVDLLWFDGDWERSAEQWKMKELRDRIHRLQPNIVLNSRMRGYGDYRTPEQGFPITPPEGPWEFCTTLNDSWGHAAHDDNYKTPAQLIRMFVECISMGGNMLVGVGPREDGVFDERAISVLRELGGWIRRNSEAVYGTRAGADCRFFAGGSTLSKDRRVLYLFVYDAPRGEVCLKGLRSPIERISVVGTGRSLTYRQTGGAAWNGIPGLTWIRVEPTDIDEYITVLRIRLAEPLSLYDGSGEPLEAN
jgi:alpha-L-fucosidase